MIFFTSDLHIGHMNIIKLCKRPFSSLEAMDESLISNWNLVVTNGDTIYIVGDLMFRTQSDPDCRLTKAQQSLLIPGPVITMRLPDTGNFASFLKYTKNP